MARHVTVCRYDKRDGVSAEPLRLKEHNVTEPVGRFGTRMPTEPVGHIGTLLHSQTAETPYTQHYHFGAVLPPIGWAKGGVAHVTPMRGVYAHIDCCCNLDAGFDGSLWAWRN